VRADHAVAAGSHRLLPSPDHCREWSSKNAEEPGVIVFRDSVRDGAAF
jgi:hypothetical protein